MKTLIKYLLQGLLVSVPLAVTLYVVYEVFVVLDGLIPFEIPGLGLLIILVALILIGFVTSHFVSDRIGNWFEKTMRKAPLVNLIYTAVKDVLAALVGEKRSFNKPVLVQLGSEPDVKRIGFITDKSFTKRAGLESEYLSVYCPHSYNISGNIYLVKADRVEPLSLPSADVMKYLVSAGVTRIEAPQND